MVVQFATKVESLLAREYPFRHRLRRCHLPQGDGFSGGGKVSDIAIRRPLGGAGERSEPEGVTPQRRTFAESGAATAVFRYDPACENGTPERIQNRPTQKAAAAPKVQRLLCLCWDAISLSGKPAGACPP